MIKRAGCILFVRAELPAEAIVRIVLARLRPIIRPVILISNGRSMPQVPACLPCGSDNTYPDGDNYVCADCGHEWPRNAAPEDDASESVIKDANGNVLSNGDAVVLIKDLKVKGSSTTLKMGTKVKSIRLVGGDHEVDCKMDGGSFMLKACFLKKV